MIWNVHAVNDETRHHTVELDPGHPETVVRRAIEVELTCDNPAHGSIKLRFVGAEADAMRNVFERDGKVEVTFAKAGADPAAITKAVGHHDAGDEAVTEHDATHEAAVAHDPAAGQVGAEAPVA